VEVQAQAVHPEVLGVRVLLAQVVLQDHPDPLVHLELLDLLDNQTHFLITTQRQHRKVVIPDQHM
jgi:hypothetical protein